jgi:hypothetical protein
MIKFAKQSTVKIGSQTEMITLSSRRRYHLICLSGIKSIISEKASADAEEGLNFQRAVMGFRDNRKVSVK